MRAVIAILIGVLIAAFFVEAQLFVLLLLCTAAIGVMKLAHHKKGDS